MKVSSEIVMYTVYIHPLDYPDHFVVRRHFVTAEGSQPSPHLFHVADTLDEVRAGLPDGLYCIGREPDDEPQIVESWV